MANPAAISSSKRRACAGAAAAGDGAVCACPQDTSRSGQASEPAALARASSEGGCGSLDDAHLRSLLCQSIPCTHEVSTPCQSIMSYSNAESVLTIHVMSAMLKEQVALACEHLCLRRLRQDKLRRAL